MTKKFLAVSLALCVMFAASSAMAKSRRPMPPMQPMQPQQEYQYEYDYGPRCMMHQPAPFGRGHRRDFGSRSFRGERFSPDMPKEIRAMMTEAAKLRIDLDEALYANPVEKEKAFEIHDKIMKLEQDIERWKFVQRVDRIEKFRKQREENKNIQPAPDAQKPEPTSK